MGRCEYLFGCSMPCWDRSRGRTPNRKCDESLKAASCFPWAELALITDMDFFGVGGLFRGSLFCMLFKFHSSSCVNKKTANYATHNYTLPPCCHMTLNNIVCIKCVPPPLCFILQIYCPICISSMGKWGCFPRESHLRQKCATQSTEHAGFLSVSIITELWHGQRDL